jgi:hypothetical protein
MEKISGLYMCTNVKNQYQIRGYSVLDFGAGVVGESHLSDPSYVIARRGTWGQGSGARLPVLIDGKGRKNVSRNCQPDRHAFCKSGRPLFFTAARFSLQVRRQRRDGLPAMIDDDRPWTKQEDALLGTDTDRAVAARLQRSTGAVIYRRKRLNIEGFRTRSKRAEKRADK